MLDPMRVSPVKDVFLECSSASEMLYGTHILIGRAEGRVTSPVQPQAQLERETIYGMCEATNNHI